MTHLYPGNAAGEILDADGKVVGRILAPSTIDDRTWREDFVHENGQYFCRCGVCDRDFVGLKRRIVCKVCAAPADWSQHAVRVPKRISLDAPTFKEVRLRAEGFNEALDAIMGAEK